MGVASCPGRPSLRALAKQSSAIDASPLDCFGAAPRSNYDSPDVPPARYGRSLAGPRPQSAAQGRSGFHTLPLIRGWRSTHVVSAQGIGAELRSVATRSEAIGAESPVAASGDAPILQMSND
jgi:hypothetical protein